MTTVSEQLYQQAQLLPESVQLEVLHYLQFLQEKLPKFYKKSDEDQTTLSVNNEKSLNLNEETPKKNPHEILAKLASQPHCYQGVDGLAWQQEQRQDRPLPFRDGI